METRDLQPPYQEADIFTLYSQGRALLQALDDHGLHQAAAHVSMALDAMRRSLPSFG